MFSWAKMMPINSSIRFHDAQNNLNDILIAHVKFYRQWLLIMFIEWLNSLFCVPAKVTKLVGLKNGGRVSPIDLVTFAGTQNGE